MCIDAMHTHREVKSLFAINALTDMDPLAHPELPDGRNNPRKSAAGPEI
jgi:hypothetical protein